MPNGELKPTTVPSVIHVQTYHPDHGHDKPVVPLIVEGGQGMRVIFPRNNVNLDGDLYIEHLPDGWTINFAPDANDIRVSIKFGHDGSMRVTDFYGAEVINEPFDPERSCV